MKNNKVTTVPFEYFNAVRKELQGKIEEVSYRVGNYINASRQFVSEHDISNAETGREVVKGNAIYKKCNIYLPAEYDQVNTKNDYNVVYLLHGVGGNRFEWLSGSGMVDDNYVICNILDNLISKGDMEPMIIVFPEGRSASDWTDNTFNPEGTNLLGFYYFDYELKYDLLPLIESKYRTKANIKDKSENGIAYNRLHRAIAGLSMGGMQTLNLGLGGYRCDSILRTGSPGSWNNGLDTTVVAPGMIDLFAYAGAFSNAPTSSDGKLLGESLASSNYRLNSLYITCGDADEVAYQNGYIKSIDDLPEAAGDNLGDYYRVIMKDGVHDFNVWNNGAYNFLRLAFDENLKQGKSNDVSI